MPASPIARLDSPIAVVCHDAGGANQIAAMLAAGGTGHTVLQVYLEGPAIPAFQRQFPSAALAASLAEALHGARSLLTGTSWRSPLEHHARAIGRQRGLYSVTVLDHWVNYPERFTREGEAILPDELWVSDGDAQKLAQAQFPDVTICRITDDYLRRQLALIALAATPEVPEILFLCEPAMSDWGRGPPGEFQALDFFLAAWPILHLPPGTRLILRPHPSESAEKYAHWAKTHTSTATPIEIDPGRELGEAIGRSLAVAGCQSYAMTVALAAKRQVFCALPPWAPACVLPHADIVSLRTLVAP